MPLHPLHHPHAIHRIASVDELHAKAGERFDELRSRRRLDLLFFFPSQRAAPRLRERFFGVLSGGGGGGFPGVLREYPVRATTWVSGRSTLTSI